MDRNHSLVSTRVAPGDRSLADMIHHRIAESLGGQFVE